jgi:hypothetical protein
MGAACASPAAACASPAAASCGSAPVGGPTTDRRRGLRGRAGTAAAAADATPSVPAGGHAPGASGPLFSSAGCGASPVTGSLDYAPGRQSRPYVGVSG